MYPLKVHLWQKEPPYNIGLCGVGFDFAGERGKAEGRFSEG